MSTDYRVVVGKNIQYALQKKGKTQAWFAEQLDTYSSQLNGYIKGKSMPNPEMFAKMADCLDLTVQQLLCRDAVSGEDSELEFRSDDFISEEEIGDFDLSNELKAECRSVVNYAKTLEQSTSNKKIISLANLIKNKATFVGENL